MDRNLTPVAVITALLLFVAEGAEGQVVRGRVMDAGTSGGLRGAAVELVDASGTTRRWVLSDSTGRFALQADRAGTYVVGASRVGYTTTSSPAVTVAAGGTATVLLQLAVAPIRLDEIAVQALPEERQLGRERVRRRQLAGRGIFVPGAVITAMNVAYVAQALFDVEGIWASAFGVQTLRGSDRCLTFLLNELPLRGGLDALIPSDVAAIELYREWKELPEDLRHHAIQVNPRTGGVRQCGVLNVWTWGAW
jgi:hypothetical protein